jgi:nucleoid-associated protein YgaU
MTTRIAGLARGSAVALLLLPLWGCGPEEEPAPPPTTAPSPEPAPQPSQEELDEARRQAEEQARLEEQRRRPQSYVVQAGDHLWGISGRDAIYDSSPYWLVLYDANADRIRDPDLILPGQELTVPRFDSDEERQRRLYELWRGLGSADDAG